MKNSKIVALVATAALLILGAAFTSMAASYNWYQQDGEWRCKNASGDDYYSEWAKSGADWYWLDDEGWMAREALVDDDTKYVDADGKMVKNQWEKLSDDEGNEYWAYFQAGGKRMYGKDTGPKPVTINGKKYIFDLDGKMMSGWVQEDYNEGEEDYEWKTGKYYCGDADDGAVTYGWKLIECFNEDEDFVDNNYWFWFGTNGVKVFSTKGEDSLAEKSINGKKYAFNEFGVMKAEWEAIGAATATSTTASISAYAWFQDAEIGAKFANGWFRVVPSANVDAENNEDDTAKWFWAKSGKLAESTIKTINTKKYAFNDKGEMLTGLQAATISEDGVYTFVAIDETNIDALDKDLDGMLVFYFSDDEDNDGSMKTGSQTVTIDGDDYNFYFSTKSGTKGVGITGKQGNKYYFNGKKVTANDAEADYQFFELSADKTYVTVKGYNFSEAGNNGEVSADKYVVISKTGAVATSGTKKDGNGWTAKYNKAKGAWVVTQD